MAKLQSCFRMGIRKLTKKLQTVVRLTAVISPLANSQTWKSDKLSRKSTKANTISTLLLLSFWSPSLWLGCNFCHNQECSAQTLIGTWGWLPHHSMHCLNQHCMHRVSHVWHILGHTCPNNIAKHTEQKEKCASEIHWAGAWLSWLRQISQSECVYSHELHLLLRCISSSQLNKAWGFDGCLVAGHLHSTLHAKGNCTVL